MPAARRSGNPTRVPGPSRVAATLLLGAAAGCGLGSEPSPAASGLAPAVGYNEAPLPVAISSATQSFRPTYHVDARTGSATLDTGGFRAWLRPNSVSGAPAFDLENVVWQSPELLGATLPGGVPAGWYDLVVQDPRGRTSTLARGFQSLGADTSPPLVRIDKPASGAIFAVGALVPIVVTADDGPPGTVVGLTAVMSSGSGAEQKYTCAVTGESTVHCTFELPAPGAASSTDQLTIHVMATDEAGLVGDARAQFGLVRAPMFDSLSPNSGSTLGGTQIYIEGSFLMQLGVDVRFDGLPAIIQSQGPSSLQVLTPPHVLPGTVPVTITIAGVTLRKDAEYTYVAPPLVRNIFPTSGPAAGGVAVTVIGDNFVPQTTQIYFGTAPLRCPRYSTPNRIDGIAPAGVGTEAVIADDSVSGSVPNATVPFRYLDDAGLGPADGGPDGGVAGLGPDGGLDDAGCPGAP